MPRVLEKYNMKDLGSARAIQTLIQENENLKNTIPKAHISTTSIQLTDSAEDMSIEHVKLKGATSQQQYEGYQLINTSLTKLKELNTTGTWNNNVYSRSGMTFTINTLEDDTIESIVVNGTSSSAISDFRLEQNVTLEAGNYTISGCPSGGSTSTYYISIALLGSTTYLIDIGSTQSTAIADTTSNLTTRIFIANGVTLNNAVFKPMVTSGSTVKPYEPYTGGQASPSPAYPQTIHRVTGDCNEKFVNKNLFDKNRAVNPTFTSSIATALQHYKDTGEYATGYTSNGTSLSGNDTYWTSFTPCQSGETYAISNTLSAAANFSLVCFLDNDGNVISQNSAWSNNTYIHTATSEEKYIMCGSRIENKDYILIELGSSASNYVPHSEQNAPLSLGNEELYDGDEIEIDYVQKAGYKKVTGARFVKNNAKIASYNGETITTEYKSTTGQLTTGATVVYKLATPDITEITDQTLLAQLETLINMKTYKDITNIESTGADLAPVLDCTYYQDISTIRTELATINARLDLLEE